MTLQKRLSCSFVTGFNTAMRLSLFGLDHCLVQTVGADSISALFGSDMESAPTQYVPERMIKAPYLNRTLGSTMATHTSDKIFPTMNSRDEITSIPITTG